MIANLYSHSTTSDLPTHITRRLIVCLLASISPPSWTNRPSSRPAAPPWKPRDQRAVAPSAPCAPPCRLYVGPCSGPYSPFAVPASQPSVTHATPWHCGRLTLRSFRPRPLYCALSSSDDLELDELLDDDDLDRRRDVFAEGRVGSAGATSPARGKAGLEGWAR